MSAVGARDLDAFLRVYPSLKASLARLRNFAVVGVVGFIVDGGLLSVLVHAADWSPLKARLVSFPCAVLSTWLLNRQLTFRKHSAHRTSVEALLYGLVQLFSAGVNVAVFVVCVSQFSRLAAYPIIPFAIGSGVALFFNFAALSTLVYGRSRPEATSSSQSSVQPR